MDPTEIGAEVVVHPAFRRRGAGRALLDAALLEATALTGDAGDLGVRDGRELADVRPGSAAALAIWAHGDGAAAAALARSLQFARTRVLFKMRRGSDAGTLPPVALADGLRLRTFVPGQDDQAWLRTNSRAFAHHPEQGRWQQDDLAQRLAEPWFDPAGFFLAERVADGALLGFHWTKVHAPGAEGPAAVGEVYVVGVDPDAQGLGLGRALTLAGVHHLVDAGLAEVILYVDESNSRAVALYDSLGFGVQVADIQYTRAVR
jgi:mycothiol synthase